MRTFMGAARAVAAVALIAAATSARAEDYPARDISVVVVWAAGGGTDTVNRLIAAEMQQHLPVRINV